MQDQPQDQEITLIDYWNVLWRRKTLIIGLFIVSVVLTMVVSLLMPKYYKSEAVIMAASPDTGGLGAALSSIPLAGAVASSLGGLSTPADKLLVFLKSRTVAEMMIKRFDLMHVFYKDKWDAAKGAWKDPDDPPRMEEAVKNLSKNVTDFKKDNKSGSVTITVEWKDPKLAAEMANYYVTALTEVLKDKAVNTTVQIVDPAVPAEKKSRPKIKLNMALAGVMSLFIGVFIAFFLENLSKQKT
jgi:succinoglycan biosynthesis transport protein ExoP